MPQLHLVTILAVTALVPSVADAALILQTENYNGHTYHLIGTDSGDRILWPDAESAAISMGGHLVTVDDAAENAFLLDTFGPTVRTAAQSYGGFASLWIGLNDVAGESTFVWSSGDQVTYTNWNTGEPGGTFADEDYVGLIASTGFGLEGLWHDIVSDFRFNDVTLGVVEIVPEPATIAMLVAGSAVFLRRRRA